MSSFLPYVVGCPISSSCCYALYVVMKRDFASCFGIFIDFHFLTKLFFKISFFLKAWKWVNFESRFKYVFWTSLTFSGDFERLNFRFSSLLCSVPSFLPSWDNLQGVMQKEREERKRSTNCFLNWNEWQTLNSICILNPYASLLWQNHTCALVGGSGDPLYKEENHDTGSLSSPIRTKLVTLPPPKRSYSAHIQYKGSKELGWQSLSCNPSFVCLIKGSFFLT